MDGWSHEEVVGFIRKSGNSCCLLVVDKFTDQMYKLVSDGAAGFPQHELRALGVTTPFFLSQGNASPMLFKDLSSDSSLPPSYSEALYLPSGTKPSTPEAARGDELEPKLCRMKKRSGSFGFHLNCIQGVDGHFISEVRVIRAALPMAALNSMGVFDRW